MKNKTNVKVKIFSNVKQTERQILNSAVVGPAIIS